MNIQCGKNELATPAAVPGSNEITCLQWRTILTAHIEAQSESGQLANSRPPPRKVPDGPPDKKRSPGAVGTAAGANGKGGGKKSQRKNTKSKSEKQAPDRLLSAYDGRVRLASITGTAGDFVVVMADGALLGSFKTLRQASAAISTAQGGVR